MTLQVYEEIWKTADKCIEDACNALGMSAVRPATIQDAVAINSLPWHRKALVDISKTECGVACGSGTMLNVRHFRVREDKPAVTIKEASKGVYVLQNDQLTVRVENGYITSLCDRVNKREVIASGGKANRFVIFDDKPLYWQAWDVEVYHLDTRRELPNGESSISEELPHRVSLSTTTRISSRSSLRSTISLSAAIDGQPSAVVCTAEVDWHETMKFLKVEFPVDVTNTEASYETAFGLVRRPTHYNTSWDMAKFEVCCHRFADLSEHGYGVSILNDSKYGFATCGNIMRLSLLRSPKAPDAHADMGTHSIRYAILPHAGSLGPLTVRAAAEFNSPLRLASAPGAYDRLLDFGAGVAPVSLRGDASLVLDTVKRGEDDEDVVAGLSKHDVLLPPKKGRRVVLRVYDSLGGTGRGTIETVWDLKAVHKANLLEDEEDEIEFESIDVAAVHQHDHDDDDDDPRIEEALASAVTGGGGARFEIRLRPFEVATYVLTLA